MANLLPVTKLVDRICFNAIEGNSAFQLLVLALATRICREKESHAVSSEDKEILGSLVHVGKRLLCGNNRPEGYETPNRFPSSEVHRGQDAVILFIKATSLVEGKTSKIPKTILNFLLNEQLINRTRICVAAIENSQSIGREATMLPGLLFFDDLCCELQNHGNINLLNGNEEEVEFEASRTSGVARKELSTHEFLAGEDVGLHNIRIVFENVVNELEKIRKEKDDWLSNLGQPLLDKLASMKTQAIEERDATTLEHKYLDLKLKAYGYDEMFDTQTAANLLGLSQIWVREMAKKGRLGHQIARFYIVSRNEVRHFESKERKITGRPQIK